MARMNTLGGPRQFQRQEFSRVDAPRIDVHEREQLIEWAEKFDVSEEELRQAVAAVGGDPEQVGEYLAKQAGEREQYDATGV